MSGPGHKVEDLEEDGWDRYKIEYDKENGDYHHTVSDSDSKSRFSWDEEVDGTYKDGSAHATYKDDDDNKQH